MTASPIPTWTVVPYSTNALVEKETVTTTAIVNKAWSVDPTIVFKTIPQLGVIGKALPIVVTVSNFTPAVIY